MRRKALALGLIATSMLVLGPKAEAKPKVPTLCVTQYVKVQVQKHVFVWPVTVCYNRSGVLMDGTPWQT